MFSAALKHYEAKLEETRVLGAHMCGQVALENAAFRGNLASTVLSHQVHGGFDLGVAIAREDSRIAGNDAVSRVWQKKIRRLERTVSFLRWFN